MDERIGFRWRPIADWTDPASYACPEVPTLATIWRETRTRVPGGLVEALNTRLTREWAIETGVIEGLYTLDRGTTKTLIEAGFAEALIPRSAHQSPAWVTAMLKDHQDALESLRDAVTNARPFSTSFIKELHAHLTRQQQTAEAIDPTGRYMEIELLHGEWKVQPNNPTRPDGSVHQYCPPEQVASEMDRLIELHLSHEAHRWPAEVSAAWLHHAFTQIHPFQDGNGRMARSIASLVLIKHCLFPLVVTRDHKTAYLAALESADGGSPAPLVDLFARLQRTWLSKGIAITENISAGSRRLDEVIASLATAPVRESSSVHQLGAALAARATEIVEKAVESLKSVAGPGGPKFHAATSIGKADRNGYNWFQTREVARRLDFFANRSAFREWVVLHMADGDRHMEILVSIDGFGHDRTGVLAAGASVYEKTRVSGDEARLVTDLNVLCSEPFLANVHDDIDVIAAAFGTWVEEMLALGLQSFRWN